MGFVGLDVAAIHGLSRQLSTSADEIESAAKALTAFIESTDWHGDDQRAFVADWHASRLAMISRGAHLLREASAVATRSAASQDQTSRGY